MSWAVDALIAIRLGASKGQWVSVAELAAYLQLPENMVIERLPYVDGPIGLQIDQTTQQPTAAMKPLASQEQVPCA